MPRSPQGGDVAQRAYLHWSRHWLPSSTVIVPSPSASRGSFGPLAGVPRAAKIASMSRRSIWSNGAATSQSFTAGAVARGDEHVVEGALRMGAGEARVAEAR